MAFVVADRVKETTTTTGTGAVALAGAVTGFQSFGSGIGNNNTTYYTIAHQVVGEWEVGYGTLDATSANLARTTVLASSNANSLVTFSAGTKDVFVTQSATRTFVQANGGATSNGILYYTGSATAAAGSALTFDGTNFSTTGSVTSTTFVPSGSTAPTNGMYLPSANTLGWSTNSTAKMYLASGGALGFNLSGSPSYGSSAQVLTSQGSGSSPIWAVSTAQGFITQATGSNQPQGASSPSDSFALI
jgi:hypothetical protein